MPKEPPAMSSIKSYFKSITLNNDGCEYLENGDLASARDCFREALRFMTTTIVEKQEELLDEELSLDDGERHSELQWSLLPRASLHFTPNSFLYQRAIFIYRDHVDDEFIHPTAFELSDESSMIVYNLGLSFHLLALSTNMSMLLAEAMCFYQIAAAIRSRRIVASSDLMDIALANNMGHVLLEAADYHAAYLCFQALKRGLSYFTREGLLEYIGKDDCAGFIMNASMQEMTLPAAA
jgi:tetratricopeptide (TPR) repeat protein